MYLGQLGRNLAQIGRVRDARTAARRHLARRRRADVDLDDDLVQRERLDFGS